MDCPRSCKAEAAHDGWLTASQCSAAADCAWIWLPRDNSSVQMPAPLTCGCVCCSLQVLGASDNTLSHHTTRNTPADMSAPATATAAAGPLGACLTALPELPPPDLSLPALEPVKNREVYRQRPESELEEVGCCSACAMACCAELCCAELDGQARQRRPVACSCCADTTHSYATTSALQAVWYSAEEPDTLVEPTMTRLRSIHSKQVGVWCRADLQLHSLQAWGAAVQAQASRHSAASPADTDMFLAAHLVPSCCCCKATVITFANKSPFKVRTLWIDFSGNEVRLWHWLWQLGAVP